jgi:hypothetical protein
LYSSLQYESYDLQFLALLAEDNSVLHARGFFVSFYFWVRSTFFSRVNCAVMKVAESMRFVFPASISVRSSRTTIEPLRGDLERSLTKHSVLFDLPKRLPF